MAGKDVAVKKYVVRLSTDERAELEAALIRKGKSPAQRLLKARILLKADVSDTGESWSDNRIIRALETSASMVYRVRKQLVEEGFAAVLSRKQRAMPAVPPIFDGEREAKLVALACSGAGLPDHAGERDAPLQGQVRNAIPLRFRWIPPVALHNAPPARCGGKDTR